MQLGEQKLQMSYALSKFIVETLNTDTMEKYKKKFCSKPQFHLPYETFDYAICYIWTLPNIYWDIRNTSLLLVFSMHENICSFIDDFAHFWKECFLLMLLHQFYITVSSCTDKMFGTLPKYFRSTYIGQIFAKFGIL